MDNKISQKILHRICVYSLVILSGLSLLLFSNPNRLAHDQIYHKTFRITYENPNPLEKDYLFGDPRRSIMDNFYSYKIIAYLSDKFGSYELVYWYLLPFIFIVFTIGMYELNYFLTRNAAVSLLVAYIANYHFQLFTAEWGLPGPSELDPWAMYWSITPIILLLFIVSSIKNNKFLFFTTLFISGVLSNIHLISGFYLIASLLVGYLLTNGLNKKNVTQAIKGGALAVFGALPFLVHNFTQRVSQNSHFDWTNPDQWNAYSSIGYHTTMPGRLLNLKLWIVDTGYTVWPLVAAMLIVVVLAKTKDRQPEQEFFKRFGTRFIAAVFAVSLAVSGTQIFRFYVRHELPFWNEPRGVQLVYYVLFPFLAMALTLGWKKIRPWFTFNRQLATIAIASLAGLVAFREFAPRLRPWYVSHMTPGYSYHTCDAEMYRTLADPTLPAGTIMQDPGYWSAFRICTRRPSVVQNRDQAFAYSLGSDVMMEWYYRNREVTDAFAVGGNELLRVAKKYDAKIIVSRNCAPIDESKLQRQHTVGREGCIYIPLD